MAAEKAEADSVVSELAARVFVHFVILTYDPSTELEVTPRKLQKQILVR